MKHVPVLDSFKFAFHMIKKNYKLLIILYSISASFSFVYSLLNRIKYTNDAMAASTGFSLLSLLITLAILIPLTIITIFIFKIGLKGYDQPDRVISFQEVNFSSISSALSMFVRYFMVVIILVILIMLGFLVFVIPGILIAIVYYFAFLVLIEYDLPARKVFRISEKLTDGIKWELFGYMLLVMIIILPSMSLGFYLPTQIIWWRDILSALLSAFIVAPIMNFTQVYIYKDVQRQQLTLEASAGSPDLPQEIKEP